MRVIIGDVMPVTIFEHYSRMQHVLELVLEIRELTINALTTGRSTLANLPLPRRLTNAPDSSSNRDRLELASAAFIGKPIYGSETSSAAQHRGGFAHRTGMHTLNTRDCTPTRA